MKRLATTVLALLFGTMPLLAHEMEGGSTAGIFGLKPEYVHVLLNPLPVYGLAIGVLALGAALLARSKSGQNIALFVIALCAASAWPVLYFGQHGYNHLYPQLDTESQQWLDVHMDRAERLIYAFYLTALLGIAALLIRTKFPKTARAFTVVTLAAAIACLGIGGWISRAGGEVSHSEFRNEETPPMVTPHEHGAHDHSEAKAQTADTRGGHQHQATPQAAAEKSPVPDTPEAIWKEIHKHHSELDSALKEKRFAEVHPHTLAIGDLANALVRVVHPDHKAVVQSGADKVNHALNDLHKAAEAQNAGDAEANLKQFNDVLQQLDEQMKKQ